MELDTIGKRLEYIRKIQKGNTTQETFAASIGKTRSAYAMYELDRVVPDRTTIMLICQQYGVNQEWLENGGDIPIKADSQNASLGTEIRDIMKGENPFAIAVMTSLASMPDAWWDSWSKRLHEELDKQNWRG